MINIVIPMAGRGSRFAKAGYTVPKPLIDIFGHPMVEYVVRNVTPREKHRFIFICQREHLEQYALAERLRSITPGCVIIPIDYITEGAACTVLLAKEQINNDDPLMIANSDQYVDIDINEYNGAIGDADGLIMTMHQEDTKYSYIGYDEAGLVTLVREKEVISDQATVGIYNYRHGRDFVRYAEEMIRKDIRVNGEFYTAPVYNEFIEDGKRIVYHDIGQEHMHGIGTPEDLEAFMKTEVCRKVFHS